MVSFSLIKKRKKAHGKTNGKKYKKQLHFISSKNVQAFVKPTSYDY